MHARPEINCYVAIRDRSVAVGERAGVNHFIMRPSVVEVATVVPSGFCQMDAFVEAAAVARGQPISAALAKESVGCIRTSDKRRAARDQGAQAKDRHDQRVDGTACVRPTHVRCVWVELFWRPTARRSRRGRLL